MAPWFLYGRTCDASRPEQALLSLSSLLRRDQSQMGPGRRGGDAAARSPGQQSFPYEKRLGDLLDGLPLLPDRDRQRGQAHRAAAEELQQGAEDGTVQPIESGRASTSYTLRAAIAISRSIVPSALTWA